MSVYVYVRKTLTKIQEIEKGDRVKKYKRFMNTKYWFMSF